MKRIILSLIVVIIFVQYGFGQSVSTNGASSIAQTTATLNGTADPVGTAGNLFYSIKFYYGTDSTSTTGLLATPDAQSGSSGSVSLDLTGLTPSTTYYYKLVAQSLDGPFTTYFASFTTLAASTPTISIGSVSDVTTSVCQISSTTISSDGASSITSYGLVWSTSTNPTLSNQSKEVGTSFNPPNTFFAATNSTLVASTKYYIRAYATNGVGTSYSAVERVIKTKCNAPTSMAATDVEGTSFTARWNAPSGGSEIDNYFLDVATDAGFSSMVSGYDSLNVGNVSSYEVSGLNANSTYYYRVRAYNDGGTDGIAESGDNSATQTVTTISAEPTVQAEIDSLVSYDDNQLTVFYTAGNGNGRMIYCRMTSYNADFPVDGNNSYVANAAFGSGSDLGNGSYVVYVGSGAKGSVTVTGLNPANDYYFAISEYGGSGTNINYNIVGDQIGSDDSNLPVELLSFTADVEDGNVYLKWMTASEQNNDYFLLERSFDGSSFQVIDQVKGAGNSNQVQAYQVVDMKVDHEIAYYRLSQVDFDGSHHQLPVLRVKMLSQGALNIEQAFVDQNSIYINVENGEQKSVLELVGMNGQKVFESVLTSEGQQVIQVPMDQFAKGVYLIRLYNSNQESVEKKIVF